MKIATIIGARPQFVKAATVSRAFRRQSQVREVLIHTGQHYDANMSDVFFQEMEIPAPDYNLEIGSGVHGAQTGRMLEKIEVVLLAEKPDWVLVYGDTNSTMAGSLAAVKLHLQVAHVESGLRSFDRQMPEEINRIVTDHISSLLFTPTGTAIQNLFNEGISGPTVIETGDVMYDAFLYYGSKAENLSTILRKYGLHPKGFILATIHRPGNTDDPGRLKDLVMALEAAGRDESVVWPVHPRSRAAITRYGIEPDPARVQLIDPVGYLDMIMLERNASLILTDSGGVQKEAYFSRVPCITLRPATEWLELLEGGYNQLCEPAEDMLLAAIKTARQSNPNWDANLYGDGNASSIIADSLMALQPTQA